MRASGRDQAPAASTTESAGWTPSSRDHRALGDPLDLDVAKHARSGGRAAAAAAVSAPGRCAARWREQAAADAGGQPARPGNAVGVQHYRPCGSFASSSSWAGSVASISVPIGSRSKPNVPRVGERVVEAWLSRRQRHQLGVVGRQQQALASGRAGRERAALQQHHVGARLGELPGAACRSPRRRSRSRPARAQPTAAPDTPIVAAWSSWFPSQASGSPSAGRSSG